MSNYPATFKRKSYEENFGGKGYKVNLFYEYRGHEYMITDERNGYSEPMWAKHRYEQERIDKIIALEEAQEKRIAEGKKPRDAFEEVCEIMAQLDEM